MRKASSIYSTPSFFQEVRAEAFAISFTRRFYQPGNMVFFVQGQYDFKKIIRLVENVIGDMIVYVENSDGNTNVRFYQAETHKRFFAPVSYTHLDVYKRQVYWQDILARVSAVHSRLQAAGPVLERRPLSICRGLLDSRPRERDRE